MGSYASKLFSHHSEQEAKSKSQPAVSSCGFEKLKLCTPPITKRKLAADPRSATAGIVRTPIEIASTPPGLTRRVVSAVPKYLQGKRYLETDFDAVTPLTTPLKCVQDPRSPNVTEQRTPIVVKSVTGYLTPVVIVNRAPEMETPIQRPTSLTVADPRSPATDFDRTPILKPRSVEYIATCSETNDKGVETIVRASTLSYCETTSDYSIPEIQAIITDVTPAADESLSLENRLDLCENSDNSSSSRRSSVGDEFVDSDSEEQVTVIPNTKILSPWSDALSAWTESKPDDVSGEKAKPGVSMGDAMDSDISDIINAVIKSTIDVPISIASSDRIKVWRDSVSPRTAGETIRKNSEEIIIEFDDDAVAKPAKSSDGVKSSTRVDDERTKSQTKKRGPQQQPLKGENKALTDERKVFNGDGKNSIDVSKNRTPLANRSNNHKPLQFASGKSPQQLFRNKALSTRTTQQENTPPSTDRFTSKTKSNNAQWDADTTVII